MGQVFVDLGAMLAQQRIVLANVPVGTARAVFSSTDLGNFLEHPLVTTAAKGALMVCASAATCFPLLTLIVGDSRLLPCLPVLRLFATHSPPLHTHLHETFVLAAAPRLDNRHRNMHWPLLPLTTLLHHCSTSSGTIGF